MATNELDVSELLEHAVRPLWRRLTRRDRFTFTAAAVGGCVAGALISPARQGGVGSTLLQVVGIFGAFLLGLSVTGFDRSGSFADSSPARGEQSSRNSRAIERLAGISVMMCLVALVTCGTILVGAAIPASNWRRIVAGIVGAEVGLFSVGLLWTLLATYSATLARTMQGRTSAQKSSEIKKIS